MSRTGEFKAHRGQWLALNGFLDLDAEEAGNENEAEGSGGIDRAWLAQAARARQFANLKKQDGGEASPRGEPDEAPAAKKQKVEGDAAAVGGDGAGDGADEGAAAAAPKAEVAVVAKTGDPMRDKVRERISKALRLVPGRDRTVPVVPRADLRAAHPAPCIHSTPPKLQMRAHENFRSSDAFTGSEEDGQGPLC